MTDPVTRARPAALVVNAYSLGNRGDAAITEGLVASLRSAGANWIAVAPRDWREGAAGWRAAGADEVVPPLVRTYDLPGPLRRLRLLRLAYVAARITRVVFDAARRRTADPAVAAYRDASLVVSVGGGYLGRDSFVLNLAKVATIAFAPVAGRRAIVAPITVNPASTAVRWILRFGLRRVRVFVRDEPSRERFARTGIDATLVPDLALRSPSFVAARAAGRAAGIRPRRDVVGWAQREYRPMYEAFAHRDAIEGHCIDAMVRLLRSSNLRLRFIAQVSATEADDDRQAIRRLRAELPAEFADRIDECEPAHSVEEAIEQYAGCDILLASRLHASLLAMAAGVPSLTVGYDPKVQGVLDELGLGDRAVDIERLEDPQRLADRLLALASAEQRERTERVISDAEARYAPFDEALRDALGTVRP
jgi:colanic acid/amylovoran biosynthesis protein